MIYRNVKPPSGCAPALGCVVTIHYCCDRLQLQILTLSTLHAQKQFYLAAPILLVTRPPLDLVLLLHTFLDSVGSQFLNYILERQL